MRGGLAAMVALAGLWLGTGIAWSRPRLGIEAGLALGRLSFDGDVSFPPPDKTLHPAGTLGLTAAWPLRGGWSLVTGPRYATYRDDPHGRTLVTATLFEVSFDSRLHYLSLPARLELRPFGTRGPFVGLGPEVGYLLKATRHTLIAPVPAQARSGPRRPDAQIFETADDRSDVTGEYERLNMALGAGVGWIPPTWGRRARVEVRYLHGLTSTRKEDAVRQDTRGLDLIVGASW